MREDREAANGGRDRRLAMNRAQRRAEAATRNRRRNAGAPGLQPAPMPGTAALRAAPNTGDQLSLDATGPAEPALPPARSTDSIELHIEEVTLRGFPYEERHAIAEGVQQELTRLLSERGLPLGLDVLTNADVAHGYAGPVSVSRETPGSTIGTRIAGAFYPGFRR